MVQIFGAARKNRQNLKKFIFEYISISTLQFHQKKNKIIYILLPQKNSYEILPCHPKLEADLQRNAAISQAYKITPLRAPFYRLHHFPNLKAIRLSPRKMMHWSQDPESQTDCQCTTRWGKQWSWGFRRRDRLCEDWMEWTWWPGFC